MHAILIILTAAIVTLLIRALPFIVFSKHTPDSILYLGKVLPYAIIPMLVVYCLKSVSVLKAPYGIPELIALIVVVCIHKWKHSTLLSILLGTMTYMFLIQTVIKTQSFHYFQWEIIHEYCVTIIIVDVIWS